jgi:hypothetical protein
MLVTEVVQHGAELKVVKDYGTEMLRATTMPTQSTSLNMELKTHILMTTKANGKHVMEMLSRENTH